MWFNDTKDFIACNISNEIEIMVEYEFTLHFTTEEYLQYYEGIAKAIQVRSLCGKTIQFPADKMREFVLADGVHGTFKMQLDDNNKFVSIRQLK